MNRLLARKCAVADENADMIDAKIPERVCFFGTRDFINLDQHVLKLTQVNLSRPVRTKTR